MKHDDDPIIGTECPDCDGRLILRTNKRNGEQFWGCTNFPRCKHTQPITRELERWQRATVKHPERITGIKR